MITCNVIKKFTRRQNERIGVYSQNDTIPECFQPWWQNVSLTVKTICHFLVYHPLLDLWKGVQKSLVPSFKPEPQQSRGKKENCVSICHHYLKFHKTCYSQFTTFLAILTWLIKPYVTFLQILKVHFLTLIL